jgi:uncharacterized membrane protein
MRRSRRREDNATTDRTPAVRLSESTRVETFSDAVLAIVLTLLVIELHAPPHEPGQLSAVLPQMWASAVAVLISFLRVSVLWLNHHDTFARIRHVDRRLLGLNLWLLLNCVIVPIPTAILADALRGGEAADMRAAAILYIGLAAILVVAWIPIFHHLRHHPELVDPETDAAFFDARRIRAWVSVIVDTVAVVVAMVAPIPALSLWTITLVVVAATSDAVPRIPFLARRRLDAPN